MSFLHTSNWNFSTPIIQPVQPTPAPTPQQPPKQPLKIDKVIVDKNPALPPPEQSGPEGEYTCDADGNCQIVKYEPHNLKQLVIPGLIIGAIIISQQK